jgi:hypothetical protein
MLVLDCACLAFIVTRCSSCALTSLALHLVCVLLSRHATSRFMQFDAAACLYWLARMPSCLVAQEDVSSCASGQRDTQLSYSYGSFFV